MSQSWPRLSSPAASCVLRWCVQNKLLVLSVVVAATVSSALASDSCLVCTLLVGLIAEWSLPNSTFTASGALRTAREVALFVERR